MFQQSPGPASKRQRLGDEPVVGARYRDQGTDDRILSKHSVRENKQGASLAPGGAQADGHGEKPLQQVPTPFTGGPLFTWENREYPLRTGSDPMSLTYS